ncbi:transglycosylase family protein [Peterkaempfera griseoplana]|uniref:transglycosylase family protein n=1 Tax=Peterkaempfera griseoplana TaxID=66896 RepID=UPI00099EEF8A|nr:transglycosylase family protein [Peterkaempfera griseoplana]
MGRAYAESRTPGPGLSGPQGPGRRGPCGPRCAARPNCAACRTGAGRRAACPDLTSFKCAHRINRLIGLLAGAAATLAAAAPPPKLDDPVWDRLADCESSGRWDANTGNNYYGGLQIWLPTWEYAGGLAYATRPDLAVREDQITVAQQILRRQGWTAWPDCARRLGLLPVPTTPPPGTSPAPTPAPEAGGTPGPGRHPGRRPGRHPGQSPRPGHGQPPGQEPGRQPGQEPGPGPGPSSAPAPSSAPGTEPASEPGSGSGSGPRPGPGTDGAAAPAQAGTLRHRPVLPGRTGLGTARTAGRQHS